MRIQSLIGAIVIVSVATTACTSSSRHSSSPACDAACQSAVSAVATDDTTSTATAVSDWFTSIGTDWQALINDQTQIADTATSGDLAAVADACSSLKQDVVALEADAAAPDATLRADIAHALDDYSTAATECLSGDIAPSASDIEAGTVWLNKATARITEIAAGG